MIPSQFVPLANHLWQSTLFAAFVGLLTLLLRSNRARMRYWLWLSASVKLLIPFSILVAVGGLIGRHTTATLMPSAIVSPAAIQSVVEPVGEPFSTAVPPLGGPTIRQSLTNGIVATFVFLWAVGFVALLFRWTQRWRRMDAAVGEASPLALPIGISVKSSPAFGAPGVFGIRRPVLLLPEGMVECLTARELQAIVAHELCHVRYRDNLTTAIHLVVETLFWFHPLVWWLGARLLNERERACDEEVLRTGEEACIYAEGILKICELHLASSPLAYVAGVTGGDLKKRIEAIMSHRVGTRLNLGKRIALAVAVTAAVVGPVIFGIVHAPAMWAQSPQNAKPPASARAGKFKVVSVKFWSSRPLDPLQQQFELRLGRIINGSGRFDAEISLHQLIQLAYNLKDFQVVGGATWTNSDRYKFLAKPDGEATFEQMQPMLQSLLADRFKLTFHRETKELPIYELRAAKQGLKIIAAKEDSCVIIDPKNPVPPYDPDDPFSIYCKDDLRFNSKTMRIRADRITMPRLTDIISDDVHRIVVDRTGFTKAFNLRLEFASSKFKGVRQSGPPISNALQEQLGLQLHSSRELVEILTIDHLEIPSEN